MHISCTKSQIIHICHLLGCPLQDSLHGQSAHYNKITSFFKYFEFFFEKNREKTRKKLKKLNELGQKLHAQRYGGGRGLSQEKPGVCTQLSPFSTALSLTRLVKPGRRAAGGGVPSAVYSLVFLRQ